MEKIIEKKPGKICELVYEYTVYNHQQNRRNIDIAELRRLVKAIVETNEVAILTITPMYRNFKTNRGIIWDNEDFSISMSVNEIISFDEIEEEISVIREKPFSLMDAEQKSVSLKTVRLFPKGDVKSFQKYIMEYISFLDERMIFYSNVILDRLEKNGMEALSFGYLGFEVLAYNIE